MQNDKLVDIEHVPLFYYVSTRKSEISWAQETRIHFWYSDWFSKLVEHLEYISDILTDFPPSLVSEIYPF